MTPPDFVLPGGLLRPDAALWVELPISPPDFVLTGGLLLKLPDREDLRELRELRDPLGMGSSGSPSLWSEPVFRGTTTGGPKSSESAEDNRQRGLFLGLFFSKKASTLRPLRLSFRIISPSYPMSFNLMDRSTWSVNPEMPFLGSEIATDDASVAIEISSLSLPLLLVSNSKSMSDLDTPPYSMIGFRFVLLAEESMGKYVAASLTKAGRSETTNKLPFLLCSLPMSPAAFYNSFGSKVNNASFSRWLS